MTKEFVWGSVVTPSGKVMIAVEDERMKVYYAQVNEDRKTVTSVVCGGQKRHEGFDGWLDQVEFRKKGIDPIKVYKYLEEFATTLRHPVICDIKLERLF